MTNPLPLDRHYDSRLHYLEWPALGKPVVFCVHGLTRNAKDFMHLAERLGADFHVIAADMAGRGKSAWRDDPQDYTYATYLADCFALLDALSIERVHWIGTSMGGILGMMAGAAQPGRIVSLTLNDIGVFIPKEGLRRIFAYAAAPKPFASRAEAEAAARRKGTTFGLQTEQEWQLYLDASLESAPEGWRFAYDPSILEAALAKTPDPEDIQDVDLGEIWEKVRCPVLLLRGAESDILTRQTAQAMATQSHVTLHEIAQAGHAPALLSELQCNLIGEWLRGHSG